MRKHHILHRIERYNIRIDGHTRVCDQLVRPASLFCSKSSTLTVCHRKVARKFITAEPAGYEHQCMHFDFGVALSRGCIRRLVFTRGPDGRRSLAFSGSNQARKGRLVDALAVRGDERRDTLR